MEQNTINNSFSSNGNSLHLRSKEVAEVMGNIPSWIVSWGTFIIIFLFVISVLLILNIHFTERIPGRATISLKHTEPLIRTQQIFFLKVFIPATEYNKIKTRHDVTVAFEEENSVSYKLNILKVSADKLRFDNDSCVVELSLNRDIIDKMRRDEPALNTTANVNCQLMVNSSIFQKVFN
jgi:hypothetical protein